MAKPRTNRKTNGNGNHKTFATQQALDAYIRSICDVLRQALQAQLDGTNQLPATLLRQAFAREM